MRALPILTVAIAGAAFHSSSALPPSVEAHQRMQPQVQQVRLPPANAVLSETFTALTSVRELADGRVLLSDPREARLVVADFTTQRVVAIGRPGQGPGEYALAAPFHPLAADSSVMADVLASRWLLLDGATIVNTLTAADVEVRAVVWFAYGFDSLGNVLVIADPPGGLAPSGDVQRETDSTFVVLKARSTGLGDTIARLRPSAPRRQDDPPSTLRPYEHAWLAHDGWVVVARLDPYRVDWRTPDGRWIRGMPLPVPAEPFDARERERYTSRLREGQRPGTIRWPETIPPFSIASPLTTTTDGRVLIRRMASARHPDPRYDVVNHRGEIEKQIVLASNERILGFGRGSVYIVARDSLDLETLRRHPWQ